MKASSWYKRSTEPKDPVEKFKKAFRIKSVNWLQHARTSLLSAAIYNDGPMVEPGALIQRFDETQGRLGTGSKEMTTLIKKLMVDSAHVDISKLTQLDVESGNANEDHFLLNQSDERRVGVFKPSNGDVAIQDYPIPEGGGWVRQVASYLIDQNNGGKAAIPVSLPAKDGEGNGSLQVFRSNSGEVTDMPTEKRDRISASSLHQMSLHRGRMYDLDAHLGNVLWSENAAGEISLTPIDNDYSLPDLSDGDNLNPFEKHSDKTLKLGWQFFPQMDEPFSESDLAHIADLTPLADYAILDELGMGFAPGGLMMASTYFYQKAAEAGLTCGQITDYLSFNHFTEIAMKAMKSGGEKALDNCDDEARFMKEIPGALYQAISTAMDLELESYQYILAETRACVLQATQEISDHGDKWEHNGEYEIKRLIQEYTDFRGALQVAKALIANGASPETMQQVMRHSFILTDLNASFSFGKALIEACPPGTLQESLQDMHQNQFD